MSSAEVAHHEENVSPTTVVSGQGAAPRAFASLYVGDLDAKVQEDQLLELFRPVGPILSVRVCRDIITRRSLGYGYVNFQNHADAEQALKTLNFTKLCDRQIRLMWQQRDPSTRYSGSGNVFVKNLATEMDHGSLHELFSAFGQIVSCKVMKDDKGQSRGYGFVHFKDEKTATEAINNMNGKKLDNGADLGLYVANFIRRNARIAALLENFTNVYIKQVLPTVTKEDIEKFFSKFGGITSAAARTDRKGRVFAFCNFEDHTQAVKAIEALHDKPVNGLTDENDGIYVQRAQHRSERLIELRQMYMQRQSSGSNLYVRNFDADFTVEMFVELFKGFGEIKSARIMQDDNGVSRGFGFVCFATAEQANAALKEMNGRMLNGKPLVVNVAQRRDHRTSMLQVQFQQRLQAMLQRMPMAPFIAGGNFQRPPAQIRGQRGQKGPHGRPPKHSPQAAPAPAPAAPRPMVESTVRVQKVSSPQAAPQQAPMTPPLAPVSADELLSMNEEERMTALGERLYVKVHELTPEYAPKITGMFLEMEPLEALGLLEDQAKLNQKVDEALCVLEVNK